MSNLTEEGPLSIGRSIPGRGRDHPERSHHPPHPRRSSILLRTSTALQFCRTGRSILGYKEETFIVDGGEGLLDFA